MINSSTAYRALIAGFFLCFSVYVVQLTTLNLYPFKALSIDVHLFTILFLLLTYAAFFFSFVFFSYLIEKSTALRTSSSNKNITSALIFISYVGLVFILIDRVVYRGIDYSAMSFVQVRSLLNSAGAPKGSLFSILGNILQYAYFISFIRYLLNYEVLKKRSVWPLLHFIILILVSSFFLGGRSIFLIMFICYMLAAFSLFVEGRQGLISIRKTLILLIVFIFLVVFVFYYRSLESNISICIYFINMAQHLSVPLMPNFTCQNGSLNDTIYLGGLFSLYLDHSLWNVQEILTTSVQTEGIVSFAALDLLFSRFFSIPYQEHYFSGYFVGIIGASFLDFGWIGFILFSILPGVIVGGTMAFIVKGYKSNVILVFYVVFGMVVILAPFLSAFNLILMYLMVLFGFAWFLTISLFCRRK